MVSCAEMESKHDEYIARQILRQKHTYPHTSNACRAEYVGLKNGAAPSSERMHVIIRALPTPYSTQRQQGNGKGME